MGPEQKGLGQDVARLCNGQPEEAVSATKRNYEISKWLVKRAYLLVKANAGAAGVDKETIEQFEKDLEPNELGKLFSAAGACCPYTEEERWRTTHIGCAHSVGSCGPNGC